ncbi:uncharacterized protein LOC108101045 [Drosophila ficusphila]|uniref:uncharacterized protein LOC108101045 n=1 Tax=Drosophila ficusphila TaxID=30025 RepID=UPI0007E6A9C9|nr:uncharacterized protein LOC108101045 [Drosophila ficusphila]
MPKLPEKTLKVKRSLEESSLNRSSSNKKVFSRQFKKMSKLKFSPMAPLPIATRDYGLMRSTNKSSTPYPRADQGVDASLLKARLTMRRDFESRHHSLLSSFIEKEKNESPSISEVDSHGERQVTHKSKPTVSVFKRPSLTKDNLKQLLSIGTPHPKKGMAINASSLNKRLTEINTLHNFRSDYSLCAPKTSQKPIKKGVALATDVVREWIPPPKNPEGELVSKRISKRLTQIDYNALESSGSAGTPEPEMSFAERRRLFNKGEFTITKYAKKMSDVMMASLPQQHEVVDKSLQLAKKANEELETYMKSQGLIKIPHDQVTMTRTFDRVSVTDPRTHSKPSATASPDNPKGVSLTS